MSKPIKIALVYQSLLGIYGDRGNATVLWRRLKLRGFDPELVEVSPGDPVPEDAQVYLMGGGEDGAQTSAVRMLNADGGLHRGLQHGAALLAVCAGYQIAGNTFTVGENDTVIDGLGLLDVSTVRGPQRAVGEILTRWVSDTPLSARNLAGDDLLITGFENHGGFTTVGDAATPLATVEVGVGNGDGTEGAVQGKVIGSYPHGPLLARNPALADHLVEMALETTLDPLPSPAVDELRSIRIRAARRAAR